MFRGIGSLTLLLAVLISLFLTNSWAARGTNMPPAPEFLLNTDSASSRLLTDTRWHSTHGAAVVEVHSVRLNLDALQYVMPLPSRSEDVTNRGPMLAGHSVRVALPKLSHALTLRVNRVEELVPGVITYSGEVAELPGSFFTFSVEDGQLLGKILIGLASYVIEPPTTDTRKHNLILLDRGLLPAGRDSLKSPSANETSFSTQTATSATVGSGIVRVLFLFANDVTFQSSRATNIVSEFNGALARSVVDSTKRITSAGVLQLQHNFAGLCRFPIRSMMLTRTDPFDTLDSDLEANLADLAFLVVTTDNDLNCLNEGSAGRIGGIVAQIFDPNHPIGLSTDTFALGNLNALHEIGHLLGGLHANTDTHDVFIVASFPAGVYAHGFENDNAGQWQTIMGGFTTPRCEFNFANPDPEVQPCLRIPYFSSLRVATRVRGTLVAIGTNIDTPDTDPDPHINNAQFINCLILI